MGLYLSGETLGNSLLFASVVWIRRETGALLVLEREFYRRRQRTRQDELANCSAEARQEGIERLCR